MPDPFHDVPQKAEESEEMIIAKFSITIHMDGENIVSPVRAQEITDTDQIALLEREKAESRIDILSSYREFFSA